MFAFEYARIHLLRVDPAKRLPPRSLHRHDKQLAPPRLPAQNPPVRRIHRRLQRHPSGLWGKALQRGQSHRPRKAAKTLAQRKEDVASRNDEPQVERPSRRLVPATQLCDPEEVSSASTIPSLSSRSRGTQRRTQGLSTAQPVQKPDAPLRSR